MVIFACFSLLCSIPQQTEGQQSDILVIVIDDDDTFASEKEYHTEVIAPDFILIFVDCEGWFGFC